MSQNKSTYLRNKVLAHFLGQTTYTFPTVIYAALFSSDPTLTGSLAGELSGGSYARVNIVASFGVAASGQITNSADITFPAATADWAQITHVALIDAATLATGNVLWFGPATTSRVVENGDVFKIRIGQLVISET